jgi:hypothetical protein
MPHVSCFGHRYWGENILFNILSFYKKDSRALEIAQNYFFFKTSPRLNVIIDDGYAFVMNLTTEKYDIIILDAFMGLSDEICAPKQFRTEKFVRKVFEHLNSDGVLVVNTLPSLCSKYEFERNLYHDFFGRLYTGSIDLNRILIAEKSKKGTTKRQIESRIEYYEEIFGRVDTNINWIAKTFKNFKKYKRNSLFTNYCDLFTYTFMDNVCSI